MSAILTSDSSPLGTDSVQPPDTRQTPRHITLEEAQAAARRMRHGRGNIPHRAVTNILWSNRSSSLKAIAQFQELFARDNTPHNDRDHQCSADEELMCAFEMQWWREYGLSGDLDHIQLFEECQSRAQNGEEMAGKVLEVLNTFHCDRKNKPGSRWGPVRHQWTTLPRVSPDYVVRATIGPRFWAVIIANDAYPQAPLAGCVNDAHLWRSYLMEYLGVPEGHITLLQDAKRSSMISALYDIRDDNRIQPGDHVLFQYSGHGSTYDARSYFGLGYAGFGSIEGLCPIDRGLDDDGTSSPDISDRELHLILSELHSARNVNITVILDCCHSGGGTRSLGDMVDVDVPRNRGLPPLMEADGIKKMFTLADQHPRRYASTPLTTSKTWTLDRHKEVSTHVLLAACQDTELDQETVFEERTHGFLTAALMSVLRSNQVQDGVTTYSSLIKEIGHFRHDQKPRVAGTNKESLLWF